MVLITTSPATQPPSHQPGIVVNTKLHSGLGINEPMTSSRLIQDIIPNNLKAFEVFKAFKGNCRLFSTKLVGVTNKQEI